MTLKNTQSGFIEALAMIMGLVMSVTLLSLNSARAKSRDAKRIADIRQIASALELWANDNNGTYPGSLEKLSPIYIGTIPESPTPPDGNCSEEDSKYSYTKLEPNQFIITFCLGSTTGGYSSGKHSLTEWGIDQDPVVPKLEFKQ